MTKISGVIITFNEEKFIENCLKSIIDVVDEIVVVDSFSTDRTKEICLKYGVRFVENPFEGFTTQKNFANDQAKYDYVLSLDADEELSEELKKSIMEVKENLDYDGYSFNRLNNYDGKWIKHSNWYPDRKIRLFNRKKANWKGKNNLHEIIVLDNSKSHKILKGDLLHWAFESINDHYVKANSYANIAAKNSFERNPNKKIGFTKLLISPFWKFFKNYFIKKGFLDGFHGFVICVFTAFGTFLKYAKIKELQQKSKKQNI
ncbi:MAG: glycosyltransferase family 2 protein [Flavobacteriaceae bacterium]